MKELTLIDNPNIDFNDPLFLREINKEFRKSGTGRIGLTFE
jgi:hypothetical protein